MEKPLLETRNLTVHVQSPKRTTTLIDDINISLLRGSIAAVVGESGSGKTTLACALTKLFLPFSGYEVGGNVMFGDSDLVHMNETDLQHIRGKKIQYIFQEPAQALNPIVRIKTQYRNAAVHAGSVDYAQKSEKIRDDLRRVGIEHPDAVLESYPHELSVGTLQRILIALALSSGPELIIADEPTSSVDASLRFQLLDLLDSARSTNGCSILLITHDMEIARRYADTIAVMYAGRIVEESPRRSFFDAPYHPYSQMLCRELQIADGSEDEPDTVHQNPIHLADLPTGCAYHPVCYKVHDDCRVTEPQLLTIDGERKIRCPYWQ